MSDHSPEPACAEPHPRHAGERSNERWLAELGTDGPAGEAVQDLRETLRYKLRGILGRRGLGPEDLEDVVQDAVVRILQHLGSFRGDSRFTTWAMAIAIREAFALLRRRRRERQLGELDPALLDAAVGTQRVTPGGGLPLEQRSVLRVLRSAIDEQLTERQRTAILGELAGVPSEELARRLATNRNALYKLHHDARRKLRQAIREAGYSDDEVRRELADASEPVW